MCIRYRLIQELNPNKLISWVVAFVFSVWTAGYIQNYIFNHFIKEIEPDKIKV
jgi:hypothetical protein